MKKGGLDAALGLIELGPKAVEKGERLDDCYKCLCIECERSIIGCGQCDHLFDRMEGKRCKDTIVVFCPHLRPRQDIDYDEWELLENEPR